MLLEDVYKFIEINPMKGPAVFWGTKITPEHILEDMAKGLSIAAILKEHPQLTEDHLRSAVVYSQNFPTDKQLMLAIATHTFGPIIADLFASSSVD